MLTSCAVCKHLTDQRVQVSAATLHAFRQAVLMRGDKLQLRSLRLSSCQLPQGAYSCRSRTITPSQNSGGAARAGVLSLIGSADGLKRNLERLDLSCNPELAYDGEWRARLAA